jgi:hypothetical protein
MPKRKKVKRKSKTKTAIVKSPRKFAAVKKKKSAKKGSVRRTSPPRARPKTTTLVKSRSGRPSVQSELVTARPRLPVGPGPLEKRIGVVTHYYSHLSVATLRLETETLRIGDVIHIRGHTTDFSQKVESLEVNHAPATEVQPGDDFGLKVVEHVREHDVVYKVLP